ncbi:MULTISPECIES: Spo0E family sporulation regulatory protein-aspartic acid phosphatase [Thermoactinomyces]|jgi:hypothetical protein|uniref:Spo0E family sporulation regulatory protein-aspartic acid phosphatase n=1 Tax=Thermoactinomyces daqus TaxID=1329516 RepID=A0A7W2AH46_9BACL|nr:MULTISPECIES: Spo0E family sporulation regulatory protein-aspartic acid phosphatase [Thermoactinomyces]MBA4542296.1 Spo0E family sporulation regulatory protein-aspartic acid phosphatase [Thermoactinomyces daqus]MBH8598253.1 Spo0E family sporulation regulatory protein-aspartic acid phosphatase [Thermoactinomyces sp. CICC 10523]MBH8604376.1 Spo0E family sporulation regulatory protein-aspartic acid phosphatase [Thermoactinomyces sp. CICC 10522]MBH8608509.1 Spo0E family sporulation regulatory pr
MAEILPCKAVEEELERLRHELYQFVSGEPVRLGAAEVLPLSMKLDLLILEVQKAKKKCCQ